MTQRPPLLTVGLPGCIRPWPAVSFVFMTESFQAIPSLVACHLRLLMTDVDGTLTLDGERFEPMVADAVARLQADGIAVGLVSGRTLPRLETIAALLGTEGPLIAENGGVARLIRGGPLVDLGYSREPALAAVAKLKSAYPGVVGELDDNKDRHVDVTVSADGVAVEALRAHTNGIQFLDSGYMIHLMADGISKGHTLMSLLDRMGGPPVMLDEVMVCGDSTTDISLFRSFPNSVLIDNPRLSPEQKKAVDGLAAYRGLLPVEAGFVQVVMHIIRSRHIA
jgi:HAD superfamily hydrolase (TIGR01484 family)